MGVDLGSFWHLTPHSLAIIADGYNIAYKRQIERDNAIAHLQGAYIAEALMATVGNMLSGKSSKKHEYPDKPYELNLDQDKNEKEKERQLELFKAQLSLSMNNFNIAHQKVKEQGQS